MVIKFFQGYLKICIFIGHLAILAAWAGTGIILYLLPAYFAMRWLDDPKASVGIFFIALTATGLLSLKWKALSRVVDVFHVGNRIILESANRAVDEADNQERFDLDA